MLLSESYKNRLLELAGITSLNEAISAEERSKAYEFSAQRVPYDKDLMIQAIQQGREVGILFQSNNEKYKMPVSKYRVIYPVILGISKKGNAVIRAFHRFGQSESEAIKTGKRSAEVEGAWRLLKVSNIKGMYFTGNFFRGPLEAYTPNDKSMISVEVAADFGKIKKFQDDFIKRIKDKEKRDQKRKNIVKLFKEPEQTQISDFEKEPPKTEPNKAINPKRNLKAAPEIPEKPINKKQPPKKK
jgi:hypothetical protein